MLLLGIGADRNVCVTFYRINYGSRLAMYGSAGQVV